MISTSKLTYDIKTGALKGPEKSIITGQKMIKDTLSMYANQSQISNETLHSLNYRVEVIKEDESEGGLQFGTSYLYPGTINGEFYMTKGHYHSISNRAEFYLCLSGSGLLVYMDRNRNWWSEYVKPNSLHYIPGNVAHRLINTSDSILTVLACWNSDAGHDYASIENEGFSVRFFDINSVVTPIDQK